MMEWTIGNYYRTHDGTKVVLIWIGKHDHLLFVRPDTDSTFCVAATGKFYNDERSHPLDIVSEWREPAAVTVEVYRDKGGALQLFPAGLLTKGVMDQWGFELFARREIVEGEGME
jgi:hypothetical protein